MLRDSAHIQEFEAEWRNRKGRRSGEEEFEPMYTMADADAAIKLLASRPDKAESHAFIPFLFHYIIFFRDLL